ncbi:MAG: adenylate/guanylate cyclase domain-containing protein, partial [Thermodesulfobacteriota bacterium]|nr:adenylate/guanylate cyclase domain-containing protein [Thermodesulfobacteriota bacterium]
EKLNKYLEMMEPVIENYRGHIDKYTGDGIMCEFGAPIDYDTHCLLAVLSGIKMQEKLRGADVPWLMRIGIGSGETITGLIGSKRQTYTAIGDVVNVASRLEEICPPGAVLIDEQTYHKVKNVIDVERLRSFSRKRDDDRAQMELIKANEEFLKANPLDVDKLLETGRLYFDLREVSEAIEYFEKALSLDPDNKDIKLIYADASLKKDQYEKIEIKGKKSRIAVYEVLGIKNIMRDRNRIPEGFYQKYSYVEGLIEVPDDVILPIEALDGTIGHSKIVAVISYAIANFLGLSEREKKNILIAGYLEDIGKQIIPHHILNRRGGLSETEIQEVEKHPVESTKILRSMGFDTEEILEIVAHHHEMYNGEGYPFGKKGQEIPLGARITSVADSYNALISWRPYREGWEQHAALAEMKNSEKRGKFDPQISEILINLMSQ